MVVNSHQVLKNRFLSSLGGQLGVFAADFGRKGGICYYLQQGLL